MTDTVAFVSGDTTFSPDMRELIRQTVETLKLDIVQGLAFEQSPKVFRSQGIRKNPSKLGGIVASRLKSLSKETKFARPDYSKSLPLQQLYTGDIRNLARKHNVELMSKVPVVDQTDHAKALGFIARDIANEDQIKNLHENLFAIEVDPETVKMDAKAALHAALPSLEVSPAVARMIADRQKLVGVIDWSKIFADISDGSDNDGDDEEPADPIQLNRGLKFRLHRVKCVDETNPEWPGDDEIAAGGVAVNWNEDTTQINEFRVGNSFDDGESKFYNPPRVLKNFSLDDAEFPADFMVAMALAEKDNGGLSKFIDDLWEAIRDHVEVILIAVGAAAGLAIGAGVGGTVGTAIGGPLGTIIGLAAGAIIGALVGWLISALKDDIFEPQSAAVRLPSHDSAFAGGSLTSPTMTLNFRNHGGHYRAYYSWQIVR
ncbi:hypothetical protein [Yoonia sp. 208BN28-4]|uniref:hypothetical protein n=1 Tax=Yoonia sp. 208BN28-4 TaxID=3126505 RepID=UPI00309982D4